MTEPVTARPPYRLAAIVTLAVLAVYVASLAPTVTFWDAGEFIAAMKILGIPHPPGTPLFVMLGHVWATIIPVGEWAWRTNLMSAVFSAASAGLWFLVVCEGLRGGDAGKGGDDGSRRAGSAFSAVSVHSVRLSAASGTLLAAFAFTTWQNSNETEVYGLSTFLIALIAWIGLRWRAARGTRRAVELELLMVFLLALSVANHLLALLAGPAVIGFMAYTLWRLPEGGLDARRREWSRLAVVAGAWALLLGTGLGSTGLFVLGAVVFIAAGAFAITTGAWWFPVTCLVLAVIGVSPYLFLYLRSAQHPILNEAQPDTWDALLAVIRREQYGVRTPFDDPTIPHGPDNPGRSLAIIWLQVQNYLLYWVWQWGKSLRYFGVQVLVFVAMFVLGVRGWLVMRRTDRGVWWLLFLTWLITGAGLVAYMNFKPGYSLGYDLFPRFGEHEVRERDYFFIVSFVVWGLWAGVGLVDLLRRTLQGRAEKTERAERTEAAPAPARSVFSGLSVLSVLSLLLASLPIATNWRDAARSTGADRTLAADFAYNLLNSVPPYGILFTYGDNDTFPLWWAQEVAGIRQDVTIVCLALAQTDWYMRQVRDNPVRDFDESKAPSVWQGRNPVKPTWALHAMSDDEIVSASLPVMLDQDLPVQVGPITTTLPKGRVLYPSDIVSLRILQQNIGRRAIVWSLTTGNSYQGLDQYVVQQGLGYRLETSVPDLSRQGPVVSGGIGDRPFDFPLTNTLAWDTYRYGALLTGDTRSLESTSASFASSLSIPFTLLAFEFDRHGDTAAVIRNLERADRVAPNEAIQAALRSMRGR